ncbi:MAG: sulfatase-like hydrolase/transferase [Bacteriovorax sp.]|nr:sulfatase-like hydrolase/transferase [Bacteriovorax sp.]
MKNKLFGTPKLKFLYSLLIFQVVLYTIFRLCFLVYFKSNISPDTAGLVLHNLFLGIRFDLRLAMFILLPAMIFINLPLNPAFKVRFINWLYTIVFAIITFLYITDAGYFSYLKSRLNATVIQFFKNPMISFEMVRESYPWHLLLLIIIVVAFLLNFILRKFITPKLMGSPLTNNNKTRFIGGAVFFLLFALGLYGSLKLYPLRWSEAYSTPDAFASNLSLNPVLYVADTYDFRNAEFEKDKAISGYETAAKYLGVDVSDTKNLNYTRSYPGDATKSAGHPNVVIIICESMGWYKTGIGGSKVDPTPKLDALAKESIVFNNFYTPTVATARSVFAAVTSLPDTSKVGTGSRNPFVVNQNTIMGQFKGYDKYYFLGGSANWGNIRGVFTYNIPDLQIFEEGSYKSPRIDVWGISDLNLFKEASAAITEKFSKDHKPFFALMQTSGFHRPYTIPSDNDSFVAKTPQEISVDEIKSYGFESLEEYNAMRLQDFALGNFFENAKKQSWYDNTIFVVFGDHSLPHNNAKNVEEWRKNINNGYHVPLIIHSPKRFPPATETKIASEVDVMPTVAGLAGIPYQTRALGRDLFNPKFDDYRAAFSYNWYAPFHLSLVDKDFYFEYIPYNNQGTLIKYTENPSFENMKDKYPEKYKEMENLTKSLYESTRYLLNNNPRMY